jgi:hypothetical protein
MRSLYTTTIWVLVTLCLGLLFYVNSAVSQETKPGDKILEAFQNEPEPIEPLIPDGVTVHERFKHGEGKVAGTVEKTQGDVYVIHIGQNDAYRLSKNQPLYVGDTVITLAESTINAVMNDRSAFALTARSKFKIDKADYNADTNKRDSFVQVLWGRARVIVENLGSKKDDYIIKTPTATCGVRGSDIGILVGPEQAAKTSLLRQFWDNLGFAQEVNAQTLVGMETIVLAGQETTLTVTGVAGPSQTLTELTVSIAGSTTTVTLPVEVSLAAAQATFDIIAANLAALDMPPHME